MTVLAESDSGNGKPVPELDGIVVFEPELGKTVKLMDQTLSKKLPAVRGEMILVPRLCLR